MSLSLKELEHIASEIKSHNPLTKTPQSKPTPITTGTGGKGKLSTNPKPSLKLFLPIALLIAGIGTYMVFFGGAAPVTAPTTANLWVDKSGTGSCTHSDNPITYAQATTAPSKVCGSGVFDDAWDKALAGDTILVKNGTYGRQFITGDKASDTYIIGESKSGVIITGSSGECRPSFGAFTMLCPDGNHIWLQNITVDANDADGPAAGSHISGQNVTYKNVDILGSWPDISIGNKQQACAGCDGTGFTWDGGTYGDVNPPPRGCGKDPDGRHGEPIEVWYPDVSINGVTFNKQTGKLEKQYGGPCDAGDNPHIEFVRLESGANNVTLSNSTFMPGSDAGSGYIFSSQSPSNFRIIGNFFADNSGKYWIQAAGLNPSLIAYNTFSGNDDAYIGSSTWVGNLGPKVQGCNSTNIKNVWGGTGSCGSDKFVGNTSLGVDSTGHLTSTSSPAYNAGETDTANDYCTNPAFVGSVDFEGGIRPAGGACDAGAHEYGSVPASGGGGQTSSTCPDESAGKCRPYDNQSPWNTEIPNYNNPSSVNVDTNNSSTFINAINNIKDDAGQIKKLTSNPNVYTPQVYTISTTATTQQSVQLTDYTNIYNTGDNNRVGMGQGALITGVPIDSPKVKFPNANDSALADSDSQYIFWDPITGDTWEFWQFRPAQHTNPSGIDGNTNESNYTSNTNINYMATNYTRYHTKPNTVNGTTYNYFGRLAGGGGGRGAGTPYFAGHVRPWEIAQGHIDHALAFAFGNPCCGSKSGMSAGTTTPYKDFSVPNPPAQYFRYPAAKSDGASSGTGSLPPEGTRLQLNFDPSLTDSQLAAKYSLNPAGVIMARALQKYGMYVIDNSGSSKVYVENNLTANDGAGWGSTITASTLSGIPWTDFRVVATPCDPTTSCSPPDTPPTTTINTTASGTPSSSTTSTSATLTFTANETSTFQCKLDTAVYSACSSPKAYTGLSVGTHTFSVLATDTAGNVEATAKTYSWTITTTTNTCSTKPGNANTDSVVNIQDIATVLSNYGKTVPTGTTNCADVNNDKIINIQDIAYILGRYGT